MMRRRLQALVAIAAALGWSLTPAVVQRAAAVDCNLVFCGTLEIVPSNGAGSGRVTSDPPGIDCTWTPSGRSGACVYQFSWPHFVTTGIDVDLYMDPDSHSYVCQGPWCGGIDETAHRVEHLDPGNSFDVFMVFNLGSKTTVSLRIGGSGAGRVTTNPAGLNCRWVGGVQSGTCSYDYWYIGTSYSVTLHRTPDAGNYACSSAAPFCGTPDNDYVSTLSMSPGLSGPPAAFYPALPIAVTLTGSGTVTSSPAGISCPPTCSKWFPPGYSPDHTVTLTAAPASGWYLKDWTGSACDTTTGSACTFFNGYTGEKVGVVFARLATPAPSATPRPPATPRPTVRPSSAPQAGSTSGPAPTQTRPSASRVATATNDPGVPAATTDPASPSDQATEAPVEPGAAADPDTGQGAGAAATLLPLPSGSPASSGPDPLILVLLTIIVALVGAVGFLAGRTGRRGTG